MLFPLVGVYWGVLLLRDTAREERVRMFIGFTCCAPASSGCCRCSAATRRRRAGYDAVAAAGGVMGALVAHPLASVISPIGAAIVCLGLTLLGLLIFTGHADRGRVVAPARLLHRGRRRGGETSPAPQLVVRAADGAEAPRRSASGT